MGAPSWTKAVAGFRERGIKDGIKNLKNRLLDESIDYRGNTQFAHSPAILRNFLLPNRLGLVASIQQRFDELLFVIPNPRAELLDGHPIDPRTAAVPFHAEVSMVQIIKLTDPFHEVMR